MSWKPLSLRKQFPTKSRYLSKKNLVSIPSIQSLITGVFMILRHQRSKKATKNRKHVKRRNQLNYSQLAEESDSDAEFAEFHRARRKRRIRKTNFNMVQVNPRGTDKDRIKDNLLSNSGELSESEHSDTIFDMDTVKVKENAF
jgi:hypothetical protein